jgi:hypothetical protein
MEKTIRKGMKVLKTVKKKARAFSKDVYNEARPLVKRRAKIARIYFKRAYKNGVIAFNKAANEGKKLVRYAGKIYKINERKFKRSGLYKDAVRNYIKARKFVLSKYPKTKRTIVGFASAKLVKAEKFVNKTYPKVEKFVNKNYPAARKWVITQLPKVQAFIAGQLTARVQRLAA